MQLDQPLNYRSGDLNISPQLGEVRNHHGETARLGPINMRVLSLLISKPQILIKRSEIFETIWKNQVVSDDALTRCISDIRGQLKQLCPDQEFIETLPRRGYRWLVNVDTGGPLEALAENTNIATVLPTAPQNSTSRLARWLSYGVIYLAAILVIASLSVWLLDRFSQPQLPVVAVLPNQAPEKLTTLASQIDEALLASLLKSEQIQLLSKTAIDSRPSNPFPYFYFEFGVRWVVETEIKVVNSAQFVSVTLVDARTGIILQQVNDDIDAYLSNPIDWHQRKSLQTFITQLQDATTF